MKSRKSVNRILAELPGRLRLPPNVTLELRQQSNAFGNSVDVFVRLKTKDADNPSLDTEVQFGQSVLFREFLKEDPEKCLMRVIQSALYSQAQHEVDEWLTLDGVHFKEPHMVDHKSDWDNLK